MRFLEWKCCQLKSQVVVQEVISKDSTGDQTTLLKLVFWRDAQTINTEGNFSNDIMAMLE